MIPTFDSVEFLTKFPQYSNIPTPTLEMFWIDCDTYATPIVQTLVVAKQLTYYYYAEAHFCELYKRGAGSVGIVESTSQGTVDVSLVVDKSNSLLFWNQTSWGQRIAMLIKMRGGFRIIPAAQNCTNQFGVGYDTIPS